jgi:hypothetical protein
MTPKQLLRKDTAKQYRRIRKLMKQLYKQEDIKPQTERDKTIQEGRY